MKRSHFFKRIVKGSLRAVLALATLTAGVFFAFKGPITLGAEAFVYGYPLVIMDITRVHSALTMGPANQLRRVRQFPDAHFRDVVRPNVDTLYTTAFLSMKQGPWVFEMPRNAKRYELMPFMDAWTNVFASPGTRTRGGQAGTFLLAGPTWQGTVPPGMTLLRAPTDLVWLIGRTQTNGVADFETVHRLQDGLQLNALHPQAAIAQNSSDATVEEVRLPPPVQQLRDMNTAKFFQRLMALMVDNPAATEDAPLLNRLAHAGIEPGKPVQLTAITQACLALGRWLALQKIQGVLKTQEPEGTWRTPPLNLGRYGTDYNTRAVVAMVGLGANLPEDALYPNTHVDHQGKPLNGRYRYQLHFDADKLPPVKAFWSVTAYGADEFFIDNPLQRYALGDRDALVYNADGSLDVWIQASPPAMPAQHRNWLPVKVDENFLLNARLYWPHASALQGQWLMPPVQRLKD